MRLKLYPKYICKVASFSDPNSHNFYRYSPRRRAKIGAYACVHGAAAAARHFSKEMGKNMHLSTVKSIKSQYKDELKKQRADTGRSVVNSLPEKKCGRTLLLGDELDKKLQLYTKRIRANGGPVTAGITMAAAGGLLMAEHKNRLAENGGYIKLNRH